MISYDVAIIGAGVVGGLTARALSKHQLSICILDKAADVACGATRANSAIVHGGFDPAPGTLKARLNVAGTRMIPELCRELDVPYRPNGSLVVAFDDAQLEHLRVLYQQGLTNGVPAETLSLLSGDEVRSLEPNLSQDIIGALHCTYSGIVCPFELTVAAVGNAMDNGAHLKYNFEVSGIRAMPDGTYTITSRKGESIRTRYLVNCAGTGAADIAALVGDTYHTVPKKGEYLLFDKSEGYLVNHTVFRTPDMHGKGILLTPTVDGNLLIGPTSEICEKDDLSTTAEGLQKVRTTASLFLRPGALNFRKVITSFTGIRATCAESDDFVLDISPHAPHVIQAIGIESPGLSAAPAIADYIVSLLGDAGLALLPNPAFEGKRLSPRHFSTLSAEEKNEIIRRDPTFGQVICRCETVTCGQILQAIHQNPPAYNVDAIKRRTRSGMGRCQGGFCTPFITELLAKEMHIPEEQVTKCGGSSYCLTGRKD